MKISLRWLFVYLERELCFLHMQQYHLWKFSSNLLKHIEFILLHTMAFDAVC